MPDESIVGASEWSRNKRNLSFVGSIKFKNYWRRKATSLYIIEYSRCPLVRSFRVTG